MQEQIARYLTTPDYEPEIRPFGVVVYAPGGVETHILITEHESFFHIQSVTPFVDLGDQGLDLDLVSRLAFRLSIHAGFTITVDRKKSNLEALATMSIPKAISPEAAFEAAKANLFALQIMFVNARCALLADPVGNVLLGKHFQNVSPGDSAKAFRILESLGYRPASPEVLFNIEDIRLDLESLVTHMTGRFNYSQQFNDEAQDDESFSYSEFGESEGSSPLASFHATYGPDHQGRFVLHAGVVTVNASAETVEDIEDAVRAHFNDRAMSLIGYYYVTKNFGACYVIRLPPFFMEVLQREVVGLEDLEEIRVFQIRFCEEAFKPYKLIEGVSRSMRELEVHPNAEAALELYSQIYDLEYSTDRDWSGSELKPKWSPSDRVLMRPSKSKVRVCEVFLADPSAGLGFADFFAEADDERCVLYLGITFPDSHLDFYSPKFQFNEDRLQLEFGKLASRLSPYLIRSFGGQRVLWGNLGFQIPGLESVTSRLNGWFGLDEPSSAKDHLDAWFETWSGWDLAASEVPSDAGTPRLWFEIDSQQGERSFFFTN